MSGVDSDTAKRMQMLYNEGRKAHQAGRITHARDLYSAMLKLGPEVPESHFAIGIFEFNTGNPSAAAVHLANALDRAPREERIWTALMNSHLANGDISAAETLVRQAKRARMPQNLISDLEAKFKGGNASGVARVGTVPAAQMQAAIDDFRAGRFQEAATRAQEILLLHPNVAPVLAVLGAAQAAQGQLDAAEDSLRKATEADPSYPEACQHLGTLLLRRGRAREAAMFLQRALELAPQAVATHRNLGLALSQLSQHQMALGHLQEARGAFPEDFELAMGMTRSAIATGRRRLAAETADQALDLQRGHPEALTLRAQAALDLGEREATQSFLTQVLDETPGFAPALLVQASLYEVVGDTDEAVAVLEAILEADPLHAEAISRLVRVRPVAGDAPVIDVFEAALDRGEVPEANQVLAGYAMAKVYEDRGQPEKSFAFLEGANLRARRAATDPNGNWFDQDCSLARAAWTSLPKPETSGAETVPRVVFVTGMPRSGTTLVEAILASHPEVRGGGELGLAQRAMSQALRSWENARESTLDYAGLRQQLTDAYAAAADGRPVVIDKQVMSFATAGQIRAALPGSRMIVMRRDPRDACFSMFKNQFLAGAHSYTTDLVSVANVYHTHLEQLAFWRQEAPDSLHEIKYEDLIASPEAETKALVKAAGLSWDEACLTFYEQQREVQTMSMHQVRQPISDASIGSWRPFAKQLAPMLERLEVLGALDGYPS